MASYPQLGLGTLLHEALEGMSFQTRAAKHISAT